MTTTTLDNIAKGEKPQNAVAKFSTFLDRFKPQMALALPKHMNVDRMARLAVTEFSKTPALQDCDPQSIAGCVLTAAQLGLEIGVNGQAYMIPYKQRATFVPGWKGLIDLVNRSGRASAWTGAVHDGDEFDYSLGDRPFIKHRPGDNADQRELLYVYAVGRVRGAEWPNIEVWPISKVWKHRDRFNKVGKRHYSFEHPEMYARKIALLQVLKYLPQSIELSRAAQFATAADSGEGMTIDGDFAHFVEPSAGELPAPKLPGNVDAETGEIDAPKDTPKGAASKGKSLSQWIVGVDACADKESAELVLEQARETLTPTEFDDLRLSFDASWS